MEKKLFLEFHTMQWEPDQVCRGYFILYTFIKLYKRTYYLLLRSRLDSSGTLYIRSNIFLFLVSVGKFRQGNVTTLLIKSQTRYSRNKGGLDLTLHQI